MLLRYIGLDNFKSLKSGQVYDVVIKCSKRQSNILVIVPPNNVLPYPSPQALAENWSRE